MKKSLLALILTSLLYFSANSQPFQIIQGNNASKCAGDTLVVNASTGASYSNYQWFVVGNTTVISTADSLSLASVSQFGEFYAVTADSAGQLLSDTIFVIEFATPTVNLGSDSIICSGDTILLKDSVLSGPLYAYQWNTTAITESILVSNPGTYILRVTGPFPNPCAGFDTIIVSQSPALKLQDQDTFNICQGNSLAVNAILDSVGVAPYTFQWSPASFFTTTNTQNTTINSTIDTAISVVVKDRNGFGCSDSATFQVKIRDNVGASVAFTDSTICAGDSIDLLAIGNSGNPGGSGYSFSWTGNNIANSNTASPTVFPTVNSTYQVIISDQYGCPDSSAVNINIENFSIQIQNGDTAFICSGESVNISLNVTGGDGNETFLWSPDNGDVSNINIAEPQISGQGIFNVLATSSNGCKSTDQVQINEAENPVFVFNSLDGIYCQNDLNIVVSGNANAGNAPYKFLYTTSGQLINTDSAQNLTLTNSNFSQTGSILFLGEVIDNNGCISNVDSLTFTITPSVSITISGDTSLFEGATGNYTLINADNADSIFWSLENDVAVSGNANNSYVFGVAGEFNLSSLAYFNGCSSSDSITINVRPEPSENIIYIPSAFSPNSINIENQALRVFGNNISDQNFKFEIFNAWGHLVFETTTLSNMLNEGWSPTNGQSGAYVINCVGNFIDGTEISIQQTINFIK